MFKSRTLTPDSAERLFATFLSLKTSAAYQRKPFPSVTAIKSAVQFAFPTINDPPTAKKQPKSQKTAQPTQPTKKPKVTAGRPVFCYDFNNSGCKVDGPTCPGPNGTVRIHACNKKTNGRYCGQNHTRAACTS